jgi:hypothetical protein
MTRLKLLIGALALLGALSTIPQAHAACPGTAGNPCVHYVAAGSSAMYQGFAVAVVDDVATQTPTFTGGGSIHHYTFNSALPPGELAAALLDTRSGLAGTTIPVEPAKLWVVYTCTSAPNTACGASGAVDVWAYLQVDSTVGVRAIMSRAAAGGVGVQASLDTNTQSSVNATNQINPILFNAGMPSFAGSTGTGCTTTGSPNCDDQFLPADVFTALQNHPINVGATDIRPEDAKYATKRATAPPSNTAGLGYGTVGSQLVGASIKSQFSATIATPIEFGLPGGGDPISGQPVPATLVTIPVGESPIVVIANRTSSTGLGALEGSGAPAFTDVEDDNGVQANRLSNLFSGNNCAGSNTTFRDQSGVQSRTAAGISDFPVNLIQREPLSGTYNTFEFTEIRTHGTFANSSACTAGSGAQGGTQECGINGATQNPLNATCFSGGGTRQRAIGTGEEVNTVKSIAAPDRLGYTFFSFGNVSGISNSPNFGYLTIDQVDPIFNAYAGGDPKQPATLGSKPGTLPLCNPGNDGTGHGGCAATTIWSSGNSFPHLRDGTYRSWSLLRQICDVTDNHCLAANDQFGAQAIISYASSDIANNTINSVADYLPIQDLTFLRSHFNYIQFAGTEHAIPFVHFADIVNGAAPNLDIPATAGEVLPLGAPFVSGGPQTVKPGLYATGGDVGGCIVPIAGSGGTNALSVDTLSSANQSGSVTRFNGAVVVGGGIGAGDSVSVYGYGTVNPHGFALPNEQCDNTNQVLGANFAPTWESAAAVSCGRNTAALQQFTALTPGAFLLRVTSDGTGNPHGKTSSTAAIATNGEVNCFQ